MKTVFEMRRLTPLVAVVLGTGCLATDQENDDDDPLLDPIAFRSVDAGAAHSCGLDGSGAAFCWGENGLGQLGNADLNSTTEPVAVFQGSMAFSEVSAGASHSCAALSDGQVYCWGSNEFGQMGNGNFGTVESAPVRVTTNVLFGSVSAGGAHSCAISSDNRAFCWGLAGDGQLGTGISGDNPRPTAEQVVGDLQFVAVSAGNQHTCAITAGGAAYCWGRGTMGELGQGANNSSDVPVAVSGGLAFFRIAAGDEHTCGLVLDGAAYCWGSGADGRLGTGVTSNTNEPTEVSGGILFEDISAGGAHTCAVTGDDVAYCWGRNDQGQLGDGTSVTRLEPTAVTGGIDFEAVSAGTGPVVTATCGYGADGFVYCWGDGLSGHIGNGSQASVAVPTRVSGQAGMN